MIDGVALAASAVADAKHSGISMAGLGTFLAIALHKPLDAFAITSTMRSSGWSPMHQGIINVVFAIACPVGALLFYFGVTQLNDSSVVLGWGLAISAGFFICISLSDLLPEVSFHQHDRGKLTLSLILGIALAFVVENLPGHSHVHSLGQSKAEPGKSQESGSDAIVVQDSSQSPDAITSPP
jgi:zinc and cadmium transporter